MRIWVMCVLVACGGSHSSTDAPPAGPGPQLAGCPVFPANFIFNTRIDSLPADPNSDAYLATIGGAKKLHLDLGTQLDQQATDFYGIPYNLVAGNGLAWSSVAYDPNGARDESDCASASRAVESPCPASPGTLPIPTSPIVEGGINATAG